MRRMSEILLNIILVAYMIIDAEYMGKECFAKTRRIKGQ